MDITKCKIQKVKFKNGFEVAILRLDLLHPVISGNKWFKLKQNLSFAQEKGYKKIITFGGAYSNHLIATAAAAKEAGLQSIAIVRGYHGKENLTQTLKDCTIYGMQLQFVTREEYALKNEKDWLKNLSAQYPDAYIIPEGGNNELARKGIEEIALIIPDVYTHITVSVGTGTTFAGLRNAIDEKVRMVGFVPMKNGAYLKNELQLEKGNWELIDDYHFGGFGKWNDELIDFMNEFYRINKIPLDIVYTSKMMYGLQEMIEKNEFDKGARILTIHTGGLQGNIGVADKLVF